MSSVISYLQFLHVYLVCLVNSVKHSGHQIVALSFVVLISILNFLSFFVPSKYVTHNCISMLYAIFMPQLLLYIP